MLWHQVLPGNERTLPRRTEFHPVIRAADDGSLYFAPGQGHAAVAAPILKRRHLTGLSSKQHHRFAEDLTRDWSLAHLRAPGCDVPSISDEHVRLAVGPQAFKMK